MASVALGVQGQQNVRSARIVMGAVTSQPVLVEKASALLQGAKLTPELIEEIAEAEKLWPHSSSVIAFTLRVDTPCTYLSASAATRAFSLR